MTKLLANLCLLIKVFCMNSHHYHKFLGVRNVFFFFFFFQRGTLALIGLAAERTPPLLLQVLSLKAVTIKGIAYGTMNDAREALSLTQKGKVSCFTHKNKQKKNNKHDKNNKEINKDYDRYTSFNML